MTVTEKKKTADVLTEKTRFMLVGWLPILLRPLTLGQIYEMGEFINEVDSDGLDFNEKVYPIAEMLARHTNAIQMQQIFMVGAYRRRWKRWLFRRYILHRLTIRHFDEMMNIILDAHTANFFLTSIIFLSQTKPMTEPKQTIAPGQPLEE